MVKAGFTDISGTEPCEAMIEQAEKKGLYKIIKLRYCGTGDLEQEWKGKFDISGGCGMFAKNHAPPAGMDELIDSLKKGGVAVFPAREDEWVELGYKEKAESLEKEGKWKLIKQGKIFDPVVKKNYACFLYEKLWRKFFKITRNLRDRRNPERSFLSYEWVACLITPWVTFPYLVRKVRTLHFLTRKSREHIENACFFSKVIHCY